MSDYDRGLYKCIVRNCGSVKGERPLFRLPKSLTKYVQIMNSIIYLYTKS